MKRLLSTLLLAAAPLAAGPVVEVFVFYHPGTDWSKPDGQALILEHMKWARVWISAGVRLSVKPVPAAIADPSGQLKSFSGDKTRAPANLEALVRAQNPAASRIIVLFTGDLSFGGTTQRGYTHPELSKADTPVVLISTQCLTKPGTKHDLAHEIGHALLKTGDHRLSLKYLMGLSENIGLQLDDKEKERAAQYPATTFVETFF